MLGPTLIGNQVVEVREPGRVDLTGTPVGRCHGIGRHRRKCFGRRGVLVTQGAIRLVGEALERFGLVGARALGCERLGQSWYGRGRHWALGPGKVQDDQKPEECEQDELRENMMRHHGVIPLQHVLRWGIVPGFGSDGIIRRVAVHDTMADW